jgi:hypothetical protein
MTTANAYLAQSANICGTTFSGLVSFSVSAAGTPVDLRSDGELFSRKTCLVNLVETITIQLRDFSALPVVGTVGQTVLVAAKHTGGVTLAGSRTLTAANSTVESVEPGTDLSGNSVVNVVVGVQSANGTASGLVWASA